MNIILAIAVVLQNASKCNISKEKIQKKISREGAQHSPDPTPVGAFGASLPVPSALEPPKTTFLDTGLGNSQENIPSRDALFCDAVNHKC